MDETPWIVQLFGWVIAVVLIVAIFAWIVFGVVDVFRRGDIGWGKKALWLVAFLIPPVLVIYGAVRFSRTDGTPGG